MTDVNKGEVIEKSHTLRDLVRLTRDSWRLLLPGERIRAYVIMGLLLFASLLDAVSMIGIMPMISVVVEPELVETNQALVVINSLLGNTTRENFIFMLATGAVGLMLISMSASLFIQHVVRHFTVTCQNRLSHDLATRAVYAPYLWFLDKNAAMSAHHVLNDVLMWSNDGVLRLLNVVGQLGLLLVTTGLVLIAAPIVGFVGLVGVGMVALLVLRATQRPIAKIAESRRETSARSLSTANQVFSGIKDIKLSNRESFFVMLFHKAFSSYGRSGVNMRLLQSIPPIFMMFLGQAGLVMIALMLWHSDSTSGEIAAQMALIVLVTSRVIPSVNRLIAEISAMWAAIPHVASIYESKHNISQIEESLEQVDNGPIRIFEGWDKLRFDKVTFHYSGKMQPALYEVSFTVESGGSYGFVGPSGAGKSTAIDMILGLILPTSGELLVNNQVLSSKETRNWQKSIGYVPQAPFIADESLRANVAFGVPKQEIDDEMVVNCLQMANLSEWVTSLENGLDTALGDRGTMLSGGQRQRVTIARALYNRPSLIVFDEATSALDAQSEEAVHATLESLRGSVTTIIIAHRFRTVQNCDTIFLFDKGQLIAEGPFAKLLKENEIFRSLADFTDQKINV